MITNPSYSHGVEISIIEANGTEHSLSALARGIYTGSGGSTSAEYVNFVSSVEVEVSLFRFTQMRVSLRPTFAEAEKLIQSDKLGLGFQYGDSTPSQSKGEMAKPSKKSFTMNTLKVRLWADKEFSPWFTGVLLVPEIQITPESISLELKTVGLLNFSRQKSISKSFEGVTNQKLFEEILSDPDNRYRIEAKQGDSKAEEFLKKTFTGSLEGKNWDQAKDILRKENLKLIDLGIADNGKTTVYQLMSYDFYLKQRPTLTFTAFGEVDVSQNKYPLLEMKTSIVNYVAGQTLDRLVRGVRGDTKEPTETSTADRKNITGVSSTNGSIPGGKGGHPISAPMQREDTTEDQGGFKDKAIGMMNELTQAPLSYEVRSIGIPSLLPNRPVAVNIGGIKFLSNVYECSRVVHAWDTNGASTEVSLASTFGLQALIDKGYTSIEKSKFLGGDDQ